MIDALSDGTEKPMPIEPPDGEMMAVFTPMTSPFMLNSGPPELPLLIAASVCRNSSYGPEPMSRSFDEMMPTETEPPRPNGLPIAITQSPTFMPVELPNFTSVSFFLPGVTLSSARSVLVSRPSTLSTLSLEPSEKFATISSAPSMTWLFVTMRPSSALMTKPDPSDDTLRSPPPPRPPFGRLLKKSSKNSSNGEPFGTRGRGTPSAPFTVCVVEMLTTASISFSASGAIEVGPFLNCAAAGVGVKMAGAATRPAARSRADPPSLGRPIAARAVVR